MYEKYGDNRLEAKKFAFAIQYMLLMPGNVI